MTFVADTTGVITPGPSPSPRRGHQELRRHHCLCGDPDHHHRHPRAGDTGVFSRPSTTRTWDRQDPHAGGVVNDGNAGANYAVSFVADDHRGDLGRAIAVTAARRHQGLRRHHPSAACRPSPSVASPRATPRVPGDLQQPNVGMGKTLTPAGVVNDGNAGANYTVTSSPTPRA